MTIEDAIKQLEGRLQKMDNFELRAPVATLLGEYQIMAQTVTNLGPSLLTEMQKAADWEAVSRRLMNLLRHRNKPGYSEMIDETLKKLDAPALAPVASDDPHASAVFNVHRQRQGLA